MRRVPEQVAKEFRRVGVVEAVLLMTQLELRTDQDYVLKATKAAQQNLADQCEQFCRRFHINDRLTQRQCVAVAESEFRFISASYMVTRTVRDARHD
jgi:hypothetical protein